MQYHKSWSPEAIAQFEKNISAHGGWPAWEKFQSIKFKVLRFEGFLPFVKGLRHSFQAPREIEVDPKKRNVVFHYGSGEEDFYFDGKLTFSPQKITADNGRSFFIKSMFEKWHPHHALYFFGYAWANYIGYPFVLPQYELVKFHGNTFDIRFPENFHTHNRVQRFYFNSENMLYRHDYHAEFAGSLVYAAHYTKNYGTHQGLKFAHKRVVRPRIGRMPLPIHGIYGELEF